MFIISIFIFIYTAFFTGISFFKYNNFLYDDFDLAHHAQEMWSILHGSLDCSILGLKFLGNHLHLIEFFIAPLYAVFTTPKTLLFLQSLFLGLGAWPLYLIAKRQLPKAAAIIIPFCYLIYPALGYVNLYEYHPQSLAIFFILFTFYFFEKENLKHFLIFIFLSLICQENISLLIIMFGFYALLLRKKIKWVVAPLITGMLWFLFSVLIVLPYFNKGEVGFYNIYGHLGHNIWQIGATILFHPIKILNYMVKGQNAIYLFQLLAPASFLPLLSRGILLFFIPSLLQHLLSQRLSEHTIYYQYTAEVIPFIFIAMIYGLKRILDIAFLKQHFGKIFLTVLVSALSFNFFLGPHFLIWPEVIKAEKNNLVSEKKRLVSLIPANASAVATFEFLPRLAHRGKLYSFHHVYIGKHTLSDKEYILPDDVEYALIDFIDPLTFRGFYNQGGDMRIKKFFEEGRWGVVEAVENIVLLKRRYNSSFYPYKVIKEDIKPDKYITLDNKEIAFLDYSAKIIIIDKKKYIALKINYKCLKPTNKNYWLGIQMIDQREKIVYNTIHPITYGIYPVYRWVSGQTTEETFNIFWPGQIEQGNYKITAAVFDFLTGAIEPINDKQNCFQIGILERDK